MHIHRQDREGGGHVRVECYVRADAISDPVEDHLETARGFADRGLVDGLSIAAWPGEVVLSEHTADLEVVGLFRTFKEWAAQWAVSIDPPFELDVRSSRLTGEEREVLRPPSVCLVVRVDGRLREVFPHTSEGTTYTVADGLDALERFAARGDGERSSSRSADDDCPRCGQALLTGQGLYACRGCQWSGVAAGGGEFQSFDVADGTAIATPAPPRGDAPTS